MKAGDAGPKRLLSVDALRALAALYVMFGHTDLGRFRGSPVWPSVEPVWLCGGTGVSLFLVLSGFSIHLRWARRQDGEPFPVGRFWRRRFVRLYPTYWAALALSLVMLFAARGPALVHTPRPFFWSGPSQAWVLVAVNHLAVVAANIVPTPFLARSWSLALEEQIYGLYSLAMRWIRRLQPLRLLATTFALAVAWQLAAQLVGRWVPMGALTAGRPGPAWEEAVLMQLPARLFEWVLGLVAAEVWVGNLVMPRWTSWTRRAPAAIVPLGAAIWLRYHSMGHISIGSRNVFVSDALVTAVFGIGYAIVLNAMLDAEARVVARRAGRTVLTTLARVGLFSYSLYLLHPPLLELVDRYARGPRPAVVVTGWATALAVSWLFYLAVERHFVARAALLGRGPVRRQPSPAGAEPALRPAS